MAHMSHVTRKPVFGVFDQVRLKLAWSATETIYRLEISAISSRDILLSRRWKTKALIRLRGRESWSAVLLFAYGINRFYHDMAHIIKVTGNVTAGLLQNQFVFGKNLKNLVKFRTWSDLVLKELVKVCQNRIKDYPNAPIICKPGSYGLGIQRGLRAVLLPHYHPRSSR